MKLDSKKIRVSFENEQAAEHVSGSCVFVETSNFNFIFECGMSQSNNLEQDYKDNCGKFKFSCKDLGAVIVGHSHIDHIGRIPLLYRRGCKAPIYVVEGSKDIIYNQWKDSLKIMERDMTLLSKRKRKEIQPIYTKEDMDNALSRIIEVPFKTLTTINNGISFMFIPSGHIKFAAQVLVNFGLDIHKSILYTSDLGNIRVPKYYTEKFESIPKANLVIGETTYADTHRSAAKLTMRISDTTKMISIIQNTCIRKKGRILIPTFALDRLPEILTWIVNILEVSKIRIPIIIDSPLGYEHLQTYLKSEPLLNNIINKDYITIVKSYEESKVYQNSSKPAIIIASSGMLTNGRAICYLPNILKNPLNHIVFCGYATEGTIAWDIKKGDKKYIKLGENKYIRNACNITSIGSFTSHMQHDELLQYYSAIIADTVALHHGRMDDKITFANELRKYLSKLSKTTKINIVNKSTKITL